jgi:hypothetical protein
VERFVVLHGDARAHLISKLLKKVRLCRFAPGENYACGGLSS